MGSGLVAFHLKGILTCLPFTVSTLGIGALRGAVPPMSARPLDDKASEIQKIKGHN